MGGIDIALLVVAADEGVMPQTREHVAILDLLGIASGVVALTKRDLVDDDWLDLVQADVEEFLSTTTLDGAQVVPCSATTGAGLDTSGRTSSKTCSRESGARPDTDRPRLPIDRVFTVAGFGTVVTGTLIDGELSLGQELEVQPGGLRARVRGLQSHRKKLERIPAGTRTAVNLGGLAVEDLRRGQVLGAPGTLRPTRAVDARLRLIRDAPPLRHNAAGHVSHRRRRGAGQAVAAGSRRAAARRGSLGAGQAAATRSPWRAATCSSCGCRRRA